MWTRGPEESRPWISAPASLKMEVRLLKLHFLHLNNGGNIPKPPWMVERMQIGSVYRGSGYPQVGHALFSAIVHLTSHSEMGPLLRKYWSDSPGEKKENRRQEDFQVSAHFSLSLRSSLCALLFSWFIVWVGERVAATLWPSSLFHLHHGARY